MPDSLGALIAFLLITTMVSMRIARQGPGDLASSLNALLSACSRLQITARLARLSRGSLKIALVLAVAWATASGADAPGTPPPAATLAPDAATVQQIEKAQRKEALETLNGTLVSKVKLGKLISLYYDAGSYHKLTVASPNLNNLILFIDGVPLPDLHPVAFDQFDPLPCDPAQVSDRAPVYILRFFLRRTEKTELPSGVGAQPAASLNAGNGEAWRLLLSSARTREVSVRAGLAANPADAVEPLNCLELQVFDPWYVGLGSLIIGLLVAVIFIYGAYSNLLRDSTNRPEVEFLLAPPIYLRWLPGLKSPRAEGHPRPPYSLARVQMAVWFSVIASAYLFIWLVMDDRNSFNSTALTLLGISLATGLVARAIDSSKGGDAASLQAEKARLGERKSTITAILPESARTPEQVAELTQVQKRLDEITARLNEATVPVAEHKSEGFLTDILRDENGISLQRLQMVGWTAILALIFIADVIGKLAMPEFSATLLGLMGISSGAYIGFKVPEKNTVPQSAPVVP